MRALGFTVPDSQTNFTWNVHPDKSVSHKAIYEYLKAHGYLVRYMVYPGWEKVAGRDDGLRITVGTPENMQKVVKTLEEIV